MKTAGLLLLIVVSYLLGTVKRKRMLDSQRLTDLILEFIFELRYSFTYNSASLIGVIRSAAVSEKYGLFYFLPDTVADVDENRSLNLSLENRFNLWSKEQRLTESERLIISELFRDLGTQSAKRELEKLAAAAERLGSVSEGKRRENDSKKGFYETIFTLGGIAAAIVLM